MCIYKGVDVQSSVLHVKYCLLHTLKFSLVWSYAKYYKKKSLYKYNFLLQSVSCRSIIKAKLSLRCSMPPPRSGKHHKLNIISEPPHKDVFISVELHDSPSSTSENLSDLSALVIILACRRSNAWYACKSRHDVTHCEVGIYNAYVVKSRVCES